MSVPTPSFASRYERWLHRIYTRPDGREPLGWASELWSEQTDHPARTLLDDDESELGTTFRLTHGLLQDVVHAAGGVEHEATRVLQAMDASQARFDGWVADDPLWNPETNSRMYVPLESSLGWDYANLLTWARTVEERIDRRARGSGPRLGLLPALADVDVRQDVTRLFEGFKQAVGGERELANYALHASQLPARGTPTGHVDPHGSVILPIPDPSTGAVYVAAQFTYDQGRDLRTFAGTVLDETEKLVDGMLASFEVADARLRIARGQ